MEDEILEDATRLAEEILEDAAGTTPVASPAAAAALPPPEATGPPSPGEERRREELLYKRFARLRPDLRVSKHGVSLRPLAMLLYRHLGRRRFRPGNFIRLPSPKWLIFGGSQWGSASHLPGPSHRRTVAPSRP